MSQSDTTTVDKSKPRVLDGNMALTLALIASLLLHIGLAAIIHARPLGRIDPRLLADADMAYRVQRADTDVILPDNEPLRPPRINDQVVDPSAPSLLAGLPNQAATRQPGVPDPVADQRPDTQPDLDPGNTQLPYALAVAMLGSPKVDLPFVPETRETVTVPDGQGSGIGAGGGGRGIPGQGGGGAGGRGLAQPPDLDPRTDIAQRRKLSDADLTGPPIDYVGLALGSTTQIALPEHLDDDFDYRVTVYQPGVSEGTKSVSGAGYFRVDITAKRSLRKLKAMPKDVIYLVDTSSSIAHDWVRETRQGVKDSLGSLNDGDRFNIVLFKDSVEILSEGEIVPVNADTLAAASRFIDEARSGGMTDVNRALSRLLVRDVAQERAYYIVLISDGQPTRGVLDTADIINLITRDNDLAASIYCVGIGHRQNPVLLNYLAYRNKGLAFYATKQGEARTMIRDLISRLRYPLVKDVAVHVAGLQIEEVFPHQLANFHQGETLSVFGRFDQPDRFTMNMTGRNGSQPVAFQFTRDLREEPRGPATIARDWAFWKLHHLYSQILQAGDNAAIKDQIEQLKKTFDLPTVY